MRLGAIRGGQAEPLPLEVAVTSAVSTALMSQTVRDRIAVTLANEIQRQPIFAEVAEKMARAAMAQVALPEFEAKVAEMLRIAMFDNGDLIMDALHRVVTEYYTSGAGRKLVVDTLEAATPDLGAALENMARR